MQKCKCLAFRVAMDLAGRLLSDSIEGLEPALAPKATVEGLAPPKPSLFSYLSVREEELRAGVAGSFPARTDVLGDGI